MPTFSDYSFLSCNGKTNIHVRRCTPDSAPIGIVQISHGIAEHVERYDRFAEFLANHGYIVVANDHLGHGKSINDISDLGFFSESSGWEKAVGDMRKLFEITSSEFSGLPYFLFGHSMGSFLTRTYIIKYRSGLNGAIICGTGQQSPLLVAGGKLLGKIECSKNGVKYKSQKLNDIAFGNYNDCFEVKRTLNDWLSRDESEVDKYIEDPLCGFIPSAGLFTDMMNGIEFIGKPRNISRMSKDLPILMISGDMDPVGQNGKGVMKVYNLFLKNGMKDVTLKLYHDCRHELLNELNKEEVMNDILAWLTNKNNLQE